MLRIAIFKENVQRPSIYFYSQVSHCKILQLPPYVSNTLTLVECWQHALQEQTDGLDHSNEDVKGARIYFSKTSVETIPTEHEKL